MELRAAARLAVGLIAPPAGGAQLLRIPLPLQHHHVELTVPQRVVALRAAARLAVKLTAQLAAV